MSESYLYLQREEQARRDGEQRNWEEVERLVQEGEVLAKEKAALESHLRTLQENSKVERW